LEASVPIGTVEQAIEFVEVINHNIIVTHHGIRLHRSCRKALRSSCLEIISASLLFVALHFFAFDEHVLHTW